MLVISLYTYLEAVRSIGRKYLPVHCNPVDLKYSVHNLYNMSTNTNWTFQTTLLVNSNCQL